MNELTTTGVQSRQSDWLIPAKATEEAVELPAPDTVKFSLGWYVFLAIYLVSFLAMSDVGFFNPLIIQDDARQQVMPYWRFHGTGLLSNSLIPDYMYHYTPAGHKAVYWLLTFAFTPLTASGIVTIALLAHLFRYCVKLGQAVQLPAAGAVIGILVMSSPVGIDFFGGLPRSFAPVLVLAFLYYSIRRSERGTLLSLILAAAFYPPVLAICGLAYALEMAVTSISEGVRWLMQRSLRLAGAALICLLLLLPNLFPPPFMGEIVTANEALDMPEWGPYGRITTEVPFLPVNKAFRRSVYASFQPTNRPVVRQLQDWNSFLGRPFRYLWLVGGVALLWLARKRRMLQSLLLYVTASLLMYVAACQLAFRLFFPSRMIKYGTTIAVIVICCLGAAAAPPVRWRKRLMDIREPLFALLLSACVLFYGSRMPQSLSKLEYVDVRDRKPLYEFISKLPKEIVIAGDPEEMDNIMSVSARAAYVSYESAQPLYKSYYAEIRRRIVAQNSAYFAISEQKLSDFLRAEKVDYLLVNRMHFLPGGVMKYKVFEPYRSDLRDQYLHVPSRDFVLFRTNVPGVVFRHDPYYVLAAKTFLERETGHRD